MTGAAGTALRDRLRDLFAGELADNLESLARGLSELEGHLGRRPPEDVVRAMFRAVHSTKGAAHSAGVSEAVPLADRLESALARVRDERPPLTRELLDDLIAGADALGGVSDALRGHGPAPAERREVAPASAVEPTVRVAVSRLDALIARAGETAALAQHDERLSATPEGRELRRAAGGLADAAQALRMQPFEEVCEGLPRLARDLARVSDRSVELAVEGADVAVDRAVAALLRQALVHLVRNAVDHGIETVGARRARGKPTGGRIRVSAALREGVLEVVVEDDGRGLDLRRLRRAAEERGLGARDDAELAFAPGVSTAEEVSDVSGRGVGLDAVRSALERAGGSVRLASRPGEGTTVTLRALPTVATIRFLLARAGGALLAVPSLAVRRIAPIDPLRLHRVEGRTLLPDGGPPAVPLAGVIGADGTPGPAAGTRPALVCAAGDAEVALVVDELLGDGEAVMRPLPARAGNGGRLALGAVVLPSGEVAPVLNAAACAREALSAPRPVEDGAPASAAGEARPVRVLLAEDSVTTRALERGILEAAGFEVLVAADGAEAWATLQREGADAVVSDVDMPRMDGVELCRAIRGSARFRDLPVILVTSLGREEDRRRGLEAGASAYLVKAAFEQATLLEALERLVP